MPPRIYDFNNIAYIDPVDFYSQQGLRICDGINQPETRIFGEETMDDRELTGILKEANKIPILDRLVILFDE
jgi:hypothetical protein